MVIMEDFLGAFFFKYGHVSPVISKAVIATGDIVLQVTVTWKNFLDINMQKPETPLLVLWRPLALGQGVPWKEPRII